MLKTTRKGFYRYVGQNRQAKESIPSLVNEKGELPMTDMEKAEVLNEVLFCFFALVFSGSQNSLISDVPEACITGPQGGNWGSKSLPAVRAERA